MEILGPADIQVELITRASHTGIEVEYIEGNPFIGPSNLETDRAWNSMLDGMSLLCVL